jgi:threonine aldolase
MAARLAAALTPIPGIRLLHAVEISEIVAAMPRRVVDGLIADGLGLYDRGGGEVRPVAAFNNAEAQIDVFVAAASHLA